MYHVATVSVNDCAYLKWYFITPDGTIYNSGSVKEHHDSIYEIKWNSLDTNGKHPAGAWNKPTTIRFSLVIIATSISGVDEMYESSFDYTWYDGEIVETTLVNVPTQTVAPKSNDVPHTGL